MPPATRTELNARKLFRTRCAKNTSTPPATRPINVRPVSLIRPLPMAYCMSNPMPITSTAIPILLIRFSPMNFSRSGWRSKNEGRGGGGGVRSGGGCATNGGGVLAAVTGARTTVGAGCGGTSRTGSWIASFSAVGGLKTGGVTAGGEGTGGGAALDAPSAMDDGPDRNRSASFSMLWRVLVSSRDTLPSRANRTIINTMIAIGTSASRTKYSSIQPGFWKQSTHEAAHRSGRMQDRRLAPSIFQGYLPSICTGCRIRVRQDSRGGGGPFLPP